MIPRIAGGAAVGALLGLLVVSLLRGESLPAFAAVVIAAAGILAATLAMAYLVTSLEGTHWPAGAQPSWSTSKEAAQRQPLPWSDRAVNPTTPPSRPAGRDFGAVPPPPARRPESSAPVPTPARQATSPLPPLVPEVEEPAPQSAAVHIWNGWSGRQPTADAVDADMARPALPAAPRPPAPDTRAYGRDRRVVQCPRCADLRISVAQHSGGLEFQCAECGAHWSWTPGGPWPPVMSGLPARHARPTDAS